MASLVPLASSANAQVSEIGTLKVGSKKLVLSRGDTEQHPLIVSFPKAKVSAELTLSDWAKLQDLVKKALRQASRLKPEEADYTGRVPKLHVGVTYDESGRYRGKRVLIYLVLDDGKRSGVDIEERKWAKLEQLLEKAEKELQADG